MTTLPKQREKERKGREGGGHINRDYSNRITCMITKAELFPSHKFHIISKRKGTQKSITAVVTEEDLKKTFYWLKPPCWFARRPISCQNSRKVSSPSQFSSNEPMSWSMTAGSPAFCTNTKDTVRVLCLNTVLPQS